MPEVDGENREPIKIFAIGAVVGAIVIGLAWFGYSLVSSDGSASNDSGRPVAGTLKVSDKPPSAAQLAVTRVQDCAGVYVAQTAPLQAADASLAQWEVHIGAMNKLVTGVISLQQATQFWNSTRVGAQAKLKQFDAARREYDHRTQRCPNRWMASANADLKRCHAAVTARNHVLRLADVALGTWRHHVMHMEMLRNGQMSPHRAETLWLHSWMTGNRQVHAYTRAAAATKHQVC
jgi:hypothetical protein